MPVSDGSIYKCNIVGYKKGKKNSPGELKGLFLRNGSVYGSLDKNKTSGVYGKFDERKIDLVKEREVEVADRSVEYMAHPYNIIRYHLPGVLKDQQANHRKHV